MRGKHLPDRGVEAGHPLVHTLLQLSLHTSHKFSNGIIKIIVKLRVESSCAHSLVSLPTIKPTEPPSMAIFYSKALLKLDLIPVESLCTLMSSNTAMVSLSLLLQSYDLKVGFANILIRNQFSLSRYII